MEVEKQDDLQQYNTYGGSSLPSSRLDYSTRQEQEMIIDSNQQQDYDYDETQTDPDGFFADTTKAAAACSVRVAVRVRPLVGRELYESPNICVQCYPESNQLSIGKDRAFTFDKVFDIGTRQQDVFEKCVKNLVLGCFAGYNATVLAYGQTGSGKTFTMGSGYTIGIKDEDLGIIPRVIRLIFDEIDKRKHKAEFIVKCTFLEIYNEELHDLLDHGALSGNTGNGLIDRFIQKKEISIREEKNGSISVFGLREEKVNCYEELAACLDKGSNFRSTASTLMNNCSSRSHAIFTISIEQHVIEDLYKPEGAVAQTNTNGDADEFMVAKFHFVDLAGSERAKRTGATGNTLKEGISINKGLLALGNVIAALTEEGKKNHVPYRDSKLTRILQDSLGGNSRTSMIACISPAEVNFEETLNSLKYASRARNIKNKPIVNRDPNSAQVAQLRQQLYELQRELVSCKKLLISNNIEFESVVNIPADFSMNDGKSGGQVHSMIGAQEIQRFELEIKDLKQDKTSKERKIAQLQTQNDALQEQIAQNQIEFFSVQKERDISRFNLERIVQILRKRNIYDDVMNEIHGYNNDQQKIENMDIDEGDKKNFDYLFGSSGPCILEEYQVKVEEQKKELHEKIQAIKTLQKDYEMLLEQSQQDVKSLEAKEKEIERLKRSVNKLQKENVQIKNEQRKGGTNYKASQNSQQPSNAPTNPLPSNRRVSTMNTERKTQAVQPPPMPTLKKKVQQPLQDSSNNQWISTELDYNIKHFNDLFIENLSQSLSAMLVKKPQLNDKTPKQEDEKNVENPNNISEFNPLMEQEENNRGDQEAEDSSDEEMAEEEDIEHLIPQGEQEQQAVIESNEEVKQEDQKIRDDLKQQEALIIHLEDNLKDKETLLLAIKESHKALSNNLLEAMKMEYHKKIQDFQNQMQQLEQERVESLKKADTAQQKTKLEENYKKKLKDLEEKLKEAKQKEREQQQMQKTSSQHKQKIKALEGEIDKMKSQKVQLLKKMKEESDQHRKWKAERVKELMQMKQANLKKDREILKLKQDNKRKEQLAKRKQEELSALMKKNKIDKQKQINGSKDRNQKKNVDIGYLQNWIISNTEKMLKYKEWQLALEQEYQSKKNVEDQISEEQTSFAQLSVRKEKLEFRKAQLEQEQIPNDEEIYQINEELDQLEYEMRSIQENIETYEEKNDFIDNKISKINIEIMKFSPDDIEQLRFDQVQSIEGARACLGAFFGILLDVNVYKRQLEAQTVQNEATIESLNLQLEELKKIQQANEINFQKQIEIINKEYQEKEELLIKLIMENGGSEIEQLMSNINLNMGSKQKIGQNDQPQVVQQKPQLKKNTNVVSNLKLEIQKNNQQFYNQSKTALSKRVAELERERKEESKKYETLKHKYEQTIADKDVIKRQYEMMKSKVKNQEILEVKQSKNLTADDQIQLQYGTLQKSPKNQNVQNNQKMLTLQDLRKERKIKKLGSQTINNIQKQNFEPRVIADEPMEDEEDENPFQLDKLKRANTNVDAVTAQNAIQQVKQGELEQNQNVFTRLSQTGVPVVKPVPAINLNTSSSIPTQPVVKANDPLITQGYEEDSRWKCIFNKEMAHNGQICALASVGNQLYSTSNKSLRIWDLEKMQVISDISAHSGFIKCMTIWEDKKLLLTASDKTILLWDMISLTQVGQLKGHKDEIRAMSTTPNGQLLFSAGKSSQNGGGLLIWDLRRGPQPIEEKEKNQDVFSLAMTQDHLFFGCRNHYVYPMNIKTLETLQPFEPPHFDVVTSLSILEDSLISGSRDKNLRCWDYRNIQNKNSDCMLAHNDWINTLETDIDHKEMYSGCKDGIVKVWKMKKKQLRCVAGLSTPSSGSINTICRIDKQFGKMFATGSSDKQLRIWKYKSNINDSDQNSPYGENDENQMDFGEDPFDKANQDFAMEYNQNDNSNNEIEKHLLAQINRGVEESKQQQYSSNQQPQQQQQFEQKLNIIVRSGTQVGYQPNYASRLEQKRREKRLQDQQRKNFKENENFQQL